jgi:hypothetical protein
MTLPRRRFLFSASAAFLAPQFRALAATDDPTTKFGVSWAAKLPWDRVVDITTISGQGKSWDERFAQAQAQVVKQGGGVIYFPAGEYHFEKDVVLESNVILRGEAPATADATSEKFSPPSKIIFPRYVPLFSGKGTPIDTAFKTITLQQASTTSNVGVVSLWIENGSIQFPETDDHLCGDNRLVVGCLLKNTAGVDTAGPKLDLGQHAWQRWTAKFRAAIGAHSMTNLLIAGNRIPKSGEANFIMNGCVLTDRKKQKVTWEKGVEFDYDNRPGIYANHQCIGGAGGSGQDGTPETHPWGFRPGCQVLSNYVYSTGRTAIGFCGDGVVCSKNVIRFPQKYLRATADGRQLTGGASTNDNRAMELRGWRWVVEDNDYEVHSNLCSDEKYLINDGEGLMHEDHCNSTILESRLVGNRGNAYLSLYHVGAIQGLHIEKNEIAIAKKGLAIYVASPRHKQPGPFPIENVAVVNNITKDGGIRVYGDPAKNVTITGNRHQGQPAALHVECKASVSGNQGYQSVS